MFNNKLSNIALSYGPSTDTFSVPVWGYFMPSEQGSRIHIDTGVKTKQLLLATLAHEMVHQLQHEQGKATHHGELFQRHAKRINQLTGLTI